MRRYFYLLVFWLLSCAVGCATSSPKTDNGEGLSSTLPAQAGDRKAEPQPNADTPFSESVSVQGQWEQVSVAPFRTCAIESSGVAKCWEAPGVEAPRDAGAQSDFTSSRFKYIEAGMDYNCGITRDSLGAVICSDPSKLPPNGDAEGNGVYSKISIGTRQTCGITTDNTAHCWGCQRPSDARCAVGDGQYSEIASGMDGNCAISSAGDLLCWGDAFPNGLVNSNPPYTQISAGLRTICALDSSNRISCWIDGDRLDGLDRLRDRKYQFISTGTDMVCGFEGSHLSCADWLGNLWDVAEGEFTNLSYDSGLLCAIDLDGSLRCWISEYRKEGIPVPSQS